MSDSIFGAFASGFFDEIVIGIKGDLTDFKRSMQTMQRDVDGISGMVKGIGILELGQTMMQFGQMFGAYVAKPMIDMFSGLITASSNSNEETSKFMAVFKELGPEVATWAKNTADEMSRGDLQIKSLAAGFQAMLDPLMGNTKAAAGMSEAYTKLAVDLSSFYNISEADAATALRSAIAGETEAVRKFGVIINEASLSQELMAMGLNKTSKEATEAEKQQARFNLIMKATVNAQGDAVRTADGYANRMRALSAQIEDIRIQLGDMLMPIVKTGLDYVVKGLGWFKGQLDALAPAGKKFLDWANELVKGSLNTLARVLLPLAEGAFKALPDVLNVVIGAFDLAAKNVKWFSDAFGPVIDRIRRDVMPTLTGIATVIRQGFADLATWWNANGKGIFDAIGNAAMGVVKFIEPIAATLRDTVWPIIQSVGGWMMGEFQKWSDWWATDGKVITDAVGYIGGLIGTVLQTAIQGVGRIISDFLLPPLQILAGGVMEAVRWGISEIAKWVMSPGFQDGIATIAKGFNDLSTAVAPLGQFLEDATGGMIGFFEQLSPAHNDALYLFKVAIQDILAYYEAIEKMKVGDLQGAYASLGKIYENEVDIAKNYGKSQEDVNKALDEQQSKLDAARRAAGSYTSTLQVGGQKVMTYAEFVKSLGTNAGNAAPPLATAAQNTDQLGFVSKKWLDATGLQGANIDTMGKNASAGNPALDTQGKLINTTGINASMASPYIYDVASGTYQHGSSANQFNPALETQAGNLNSIATGANNAAGGYNNLADAYANYLRSMGAAVQGPIGPNGEMPTATAPYTPEEIAAALGGGTPPGGNWGVSPTGTDTTSAAYAAAQRKALADAEAAAKAREGGVSGYGVTVVRQWQEGGYWWTQFSDGTTKRGDAVSTQPGLGGGRNTPLRLPEDYQTQRVYAPQYNLTFNNPKYESPTESMNTIRKIDRMLGMRGGQFA